MLLVAPPVEDSEQKENMVIDSRQEIIKDPVYNYRRLEPIPKNEELAEFYQSKYYNLIAEGGRAPELRRLISGGEEAESERRWLRETLYSDICYILTQHTSGKEVLDIGCGTGEFLRFLKEQGFNARGIEPSSDAAAIATSVGLSVECCSLEKSVESYDQNCVKPFDAITLLNVLEHVPNPVQVIEMTRAMLRQGGILCVRVPNDFNDLQLAAQKKLNTKQWWVSSPDHINYFNFQDLYNLLDRLGFEVIYSQGDFPMELFLLMGEDYTNDSSIGNNCHKKRVSFDLAIPGELRRAFYQALAQIKIGRACLVFCRLR